MINPDQLQNELLLLTHHIDDVIKAVSAKQNEMAMAGLKDAKEIADRMVGLLSPSSRGEIERIADEIQDM